MKQFIKYDLEPEIKAENDYKINVEISPLELGMGTTIGNALRRICLSSIPGVAPFAIRIEGVSHEFTSIKGVYEDVTEIILNIKKLVLEIDEEIFPHYELMDTPLEK
jgi:DNA-directed RNA polymerase subunit alpha